MKRVALLLASMALTVLLVSGVALAVNKLGGPGDDVLYGTNMPDLLYGDEGDDVLYGRGGNDSGELGSGEGGALIGGPGDDTIYAGAGADWLFSDIGFGDPSTYYDTNILYGGKGPDDFYGGGGSDVFYGGPGNDWIVGSHDVRATGPDTFYGGGGNDEIISSRVPGDVRVRELVNCGPGTDRVVADTKDVVARNCEQVKRVS